MHLRLSKICGNDVASIWGNVMMSYIICICHNLNNAFSGDFGHINDILLMKTTLFNAGESYITALTKSNIFVMTNAYI